MASFISSTLYASNVGMQAERRLYCSVDNCDHIEPFTKHFQKQHHEFLVHRDILIMYHPNRSIGLFGLKRQDDGSFHCGCNECFADVEMAEEHAKQCAHIVIGDLYQQQQQQIGSSTTTAIDVFSIPEESIAAPGQDISSDIQPVRPYKSKDQIVKYIEEYENQLEYLLNIVIHRASGAILCAFPDCKQRSLKFDTARKHLITEHNYAAVNSPYGEEEFKNLLSKHGGRRFEEMGDYYNVQKTPLKPISLLPVHNGYLCNHCQVFAHKGTQTMENHISAKHPGLSIKDYSKRLVQTVYVGRPVYYLVQNPNVPAAPIAAENVLQAREALLAKLPYAKMIEKPVDQGAVGFESDRERLVNLFMNHFKMQDFIERFLPGDLNTLSNRTKLWEFSNKERVQCQVYKNIRKGTRALFQLLQSHMRQSSHGYFYRALVTKLNKDDTANKALKPLEPSSHYKYCLHWENMLVMLCRVLFPTDEPGSAIYCSMNMKRSLRVLHENCGSHSRLFVFLMMMLWWKVFWSFYCVTLWESFTLSNFFLEVDLAISGNHLSAVLAARV